MPGAVTMALPTDYAGSADAGCVGSFTVSVQWAADGTGTVNGETCYNVLCGEGGLGTQGDSGSLIGSAPGCPAPTTASLNPNDQMYECNVSLVCDGGVTNAFVSNGQPVSVQWRTGSSGCTAHAPAGSQ